MLKYEEPIAKSLDICWKVVLQRSRILLVSAAVGIHVSGNDTRQKRWCRNVYLSQANVIRDYLPKMCYYEVGGWTAKPDPLFPLMAFDLLEEAIGFVKSCSYRDTLEIFASVYEPERNFPYGVEDWFDRVDVFHGRLPYHTILVSRLMLMEQVDWR